VWVAAVSVAKAVGVIQKEAWVLPLAGAAVNQFPSAVMVQVSGSPLPTSNGVT